MNNTRTEPGTWDVYLNTDNEADSLAHENSLHVDEAAALVDQLRASGHPDAYATNTDATDGEYYPADVTAWSVWGLDDDVAMEPVEIAGNLTRADAIARVDKLLEKGYPGVYASNHHTDEVYGGCEPVGLLDMNTPDDSAHIRLTLRNGTYMLTWNDGVANEWTEKYRDAALAFARVAVLLRAVAADRFFRHRTPDSGQAPTGFVADADVFLNGQLA